MDKLIITPGKVRGLGNLLTPKQVEDLILYQSEVSIASDGTFIMDYSQSNLIVSDYTTILINGATTSVTVRVLDDEEAPVSDVPVTLYDGTTSIASGTTDSQGYAVVSYTLSTDGSHMLHVEANSLKSKRWEVLVSTISSITLSRSTTEVWKGSEVTFSALVKDTNQNIMAGVPVHFIITDGVTVLKNETITTDANGISSTYYAGEFFPNGTITCNTTCGGVSESTLVTEIFRYYVNGPVPEGYFVLYDFVPQGELKDANGNLILPKNQQQSTKIFFNETLPEKFNIQWEYKGSITNFNGAQFGIANNQDGFSWYNQSVVTFTNNAFTVNGQTFSGSLQTGDIFNFNYDGESLEISQIRNNTVLWSKIVTVSIEDSTLAFNLGTYNGYKMNNVIATYYDRTPPVPSFDGITLTGNKNILSAADSEYVTLEAQLTDGGSAASVEGETVTFTIYKDSDDSVVTTLTADTNSSGVATVSYYGEGAGDLYIKGSVDSIISSEIYVEDCKYWNDGSSVGSLEVGSSVSCTSNGSYITITTSTSGEKDVKLPVALSGDWEFETTLAENLPSGSQLTFKIGTGQQWGGFNYGNNITVNLGSSQTFNKTVSKDMVLKITYISGVMTVYWNNEQLTYKSLTLSSGVKMGYYTNNGRYQYLKNIKLKPL